MNSDDIKDAIAIWQKQRDQLINKFQGVRPSYVSTDIAILGACIMRYKAKLEEMESKE